MGNVVVLLWIQQCMLNSLLCELAYLREHINLLNRDVETLQKNVKGIYGIKGG